MRLSLVACRLPSGGTPGRSPLPPSTPPAAPPRLPRSRRRGARPRAPPAHTHGRRDVPPTANLLARDAYIDMIRTAQNVADRYELNREEIDAFALRSHQHAAAARDSGRLAKEIHPVEIPATRRTPARTFEHDESIRDDTTAEKLAALPAQPNTTQMTAGDSSPLNHGASSVVLANATAAQELGVEPPA